MPKLIISLALLLAATCARTADEAALYAIANKQGREQGAQPPAPADVPTPAQIVQEAAANQAGGDEIEHLRGLIEQSRRRSLDLLPELRDFAESVKGDTRMPDASTAVLPEEREQILIFVSRSMGDIELTEVMREAAKRVDVTVVFNGIYPHETISQAFNVFQGLMVRAGVEETPPTVVIDPRLFRQFGVDRVPEIVMARGNNELVRAQGTYGIEWIETRYTSGRIGDLGSFGAVHAVAEPDLVELIRSRLASLDLAALKRKALDRFWQHQQFVDLAPAGEDRLRRLDPTIVNQVPLLNAEGEVVVEAGVEINPLDHLPFNWRLMIFDPSRAVERAFVAQWIRAQDPLQRIQLLVTQIPRDEGWDFLRSLENELGYPVYLLTSDVRDRFGLSATPSEVYADQSLFYVRETELEDPAS